MNRLLYAIVGLILSFHCDALRFLCEPNEEFSKHSAKVKVVYEWDVDTWVIIITAPAFIEGLPFGLVQINKGEDGNIFSAQLRTVKKEDEIEAHFYANEEILEGMTLSLAYGEVCMEGFSVPLKHNKSLKHQSPHSLDSL